MNLSESVLIKAEFWMLVITSLTLPGYIIGHLLRTAQIARGVLVGYALSLLLLSGADTLLIKRLSALALQTSDLADDQIFASEYSLALYLLPLMAAGIGVNLLSYAITQHLRIIQQPEPPPAAVPQPPVATDEPKSADSGES